MNSKKPKIFNDLNQIFETKKNNLLSIYFTAGYPKLNDLPTIIEKLSLSGVDFIEVGSPFNDPIADGETIQESAAIALENGMSVNLMFEQLDNFKQKQGSRKTAPLIWMGYFNLMMHYGVEKFCQRAKEVGFCGLIVPDLPPEYYEKYQGSFERHQLNFIFLISPFTPKERILEIDRKANVFIYAVSSQSITGQAGEINQSFFKQLKQMKLKNPLMIGFNIKDKKGYDSACELGAGAIIGSSFIRHLKENGVDSTATFVESIRKTK